MFEEFLNSFVKVAVKVADGGKPALLIQFAQKHGLTTADSQSNVALAQNSSKVDMGCPGIQDPLKPEYIEKNWTYSASLVNNDKLNRGKQAIKVITTINSIEKDQNNTNLIKELQDPRAQAMFIYVINKSTLPFIQQNKKLLLEAAKKDWVQTDKGIWDKYVAPTFEALKNQQQIQQPVQENVDYQIMMNNLKLQEMEEKQKLLKQEEAELQKALQISLQQSQNSNLYMQEKSQIQQKDQNSSLIGVDIEKIFASHSISSKELVHYLAKAEFFATKDLKEYLSKALLELERTYNFTKEELDKVQKYVISEEFEAYIEAFIDETLKKHEYQTKLDKTLTKALNYINKESFFTNDDNLTDAISVLRLLKAGYSENFKNMDLLLSSIDKAILLQNALNACGLENEEGLLKLFIDKNCMPNNVYKYLQEKNVPQETLGILYTYIKNSPAFFTNLQNYEIDKVLNGLDKKTGKIHISATEDGLFTKSLLYLDYLDPLKGQHHVNTSYLKTLQNFLVDHSTEMQKGVSINKLEAFEIFVSGNIDIFDLDN